MTKNLRKRLAPAPASRGVHYFFSWTLAELSRTHPWYEMGPKIGPLITKGVMVLKRDFEGRWYEWGKAAFQVKPPLLPYLLELMGEVDRGELNKEQALKKLFDSSLVSWRGIEGIEKYPKEAILNALWELEETRYFIVNRITDLLEFELFGLEEKVKGLESLLLKTGNLKN